MQFFEANFILVFLVYFIDVALVTASFYLMNSLIGFTSGSQIDFVTRTLGPNLLYNMIFFVILYLPLQKLFTLAKWGEN